MSNLGNAYVLASALYARDRSLPLGEIADNIYDCVEAINFGIDERKADLYAQLEHKLTPTTTFLEAVDIIVLAMNRTDRSYPSMASCIVHKSIELDNLSKKARAALTDTDWVISPKYDGCHAVFCFEDGKHLATYSRSGELVRSMDHIAASLLDLYPLVKGRLAICGEAWMVGEEFNVISGAFRRHSPQPQLQFVPFDMVPFDVVDGLPVLGQSDGRIYPAKYIDRLGNLVVYRNNTVPSQVLVPRYSVLAAYGLDHALAVARGVALENKARTDCFFDGAILARANGKYEVGAGKGGEFIKIKPLISHTVQVGAVIADVGSKTGKVTCVLCFDLNGEVQKVSTGLTQQQAEEYVNNPNAILDQYIEVEAMGLTVNGLLREPRFKGIRTDV